MTILLDQVKSYKVHEKLFSDTLTGTTEIRTAQTLLKKIAP